MKKVLITFSNGRTVQFQAQEVHSPIDGKFLKFTKDDYTEVYFNSDHVLGIEVK